MQITTVGLDLAKNVIQLYAVNQHGKAVLQKSLKRNQVLPFFANLTPCLIAMEACSSAHYWARKLQTMGYAVRLMAPQFVKPYVKTNKNDAADAEAICEAVARPNTRFVPVKDIEQQAVLSVHRARQGFVKARTAQANQIRGLLGEYGIILPQGMTHLTQDLPAILEDFSDDLSAVFRQLVQPLPKHIKELDRQVSELELQIQLWHRESATSPKLAQIPGIGAITASAMVASIGDARCFKNGRQLAACLGLVPRQHSSGGKPTLLGISKRGDSYMRTMVIYRARAVLRVAQRKANYAGSWLANLMNRRHQNIAAVALAGIAITMDGRGCWRDNVFVERLWKSIKYEKVYLRSYETVSAARSGIARYIDFYNTRRPHSSLHGMTPDALYFKLPPMQRAA